MLRVTNADSKKKKKKKRACDLDARLIASASAYVISISIVVAVADSSRGQVFCLPVARATLFCRMHRIRGVLRTYHPIRGMLGRV